MRLRPLKLVLIAAALLTLVLPPEILADNGQRVTFARGQSSVTLSGKLPRKFADYYYYLVRARKGQTLTVELESSDPNAHLAIFETDKLGPDEDTLLGVDEAAREWSGKLPVTSDYSVQVYGVREMDARGNGAPYKITIAVR
jgi:hypothetical protein